MSTSAAVRDGYKQTEVGVIPEAWEVRRLGEVVDFLDGQRRPVKDTDRGKMRGDIPYYGASGIVDYVNDYLFDDELILLGALCTKWFTCWKGITGSGLPG